MVSLEGNNSENEIAHELAQRLRENLLVYNSLQREVMHDFEVSKKLPHKESGLRWIEEYSPKFETSFFHVVERMVDHGQITTDTKPEEILQKYKENIVHEIEGELWEKAA